MPSWKNTRNVSLFLEQSKTFGVSYSKGINQFRDNKISLAITFVVSFFKLLILYWSIAD